MARLEVKNIKKEYHRKIVVNDVSFSVDSGRILGLVGANGAGKTTLISMIATLIKPDGGTIIYDGKTLKDAKKEIHSMIGYVPQEISLYESLSGYDNLRFWGRSYGVPAKQLKSEIERVAGIISFDSGMLYKKVEEYSGGMKRRLNIGAALLHRPQILLLDEPTAGVDSASSEVILDAIKKLAAEGTTVIFVDHYATEVESIATDLCLMKEGVVVSCGNKTEILQGRRLEELLR